MGKLSGKPVNPLYLKSSMVLAMTKLYRWLVNVITTPNHLCFSELIDTIDAVPFLPWNCKKTKIDNKRKRTQGSHPI